MRGITTPKDTRFRYYAWFYDVVEQELKIAFAKMEILPMWKSELQSESWEDTQSDDLQLNKTYRDKNRTAPL